MQQYAGSWAVVRPVWRIRPPCPVVLAIPHGERQVVHPGQSGIPSRSSSTTTPYAIHRWAGSTAGGGFATSVRRTSLVANWISRISTQGWTSDPLSPVGSVYRPVVDGGTITLPAGSVRTGAGQSSPRLASVHRIGGGVAVGAVIPGVGLGATTPGRGWGWGPSPASGSDGRPPAVRCAGSGTELPSTSTPMTAPPRAASEGYRHDRRSLDPVGASAASPTADGRGGGDGRRLGSRDVQVGVGPQGVRESRSNRRTGRSHPSEALREVEAGDGRGGRERRMTTSPGRARSHRSELGDVAQGDQRPVGRIERREDPSQIGVGDPRCQRVRPRSGTPSSSTSATEISRIVGRRARMIRRASFAATATSQPRIWAGP